MRKCMPEIYTFKRQQTPSTSRSILLWPLSLRKIRFQLPRIFMISGDTCPRSSVTLSTSSFFCSSHFEHPFLLCSHLFWFGKYSFLFHKNPLCSEHTCELTRAWAQHALWPFWGFVHLCVPIDQRVSAGSPSSALLCIFKNMQQESSPLFG